MTGIGLARAEQQRRGAWITYHPYWSKLRPLALVVSVSLALAAPVAAQIKQIDTTGLKKVLTESRNAEEAQQRLVARDYPDYKAANDATAEAFAQGDLAKTLAAARAALHLYREDAKVYSARSHAQLLGNAYELLSQFYADPFQREQIFLPYLFDEIQLMQTRDAIPHQKILDVVVAFGRQAEGRYLRFLGKKRIDQLDELWARAVTDARLLRGRDHELTMLLQYFQISFARHDEKAKTTRSRFDDYIKAVVRLKQPSNAMLGLSHWARLEMSDGEHEKVRARAVKVITQDLKGVEIEKASQARLLAMVANGYLSEYGPDRTEAVLREFKDAAGFDVWDQAAGPSASINVQPILRVEPRFRKIRKREEITLEFNVSREGSVIADSMEVMSTTSKGIVKPALRAVRQWKYRPKFMDGVFVIQEGVRVRFVIAAPDR